MYVATLYAFASAKREYTRSSPRSTVFSHNDKGYNFVSCLLNEHLLTVNIFKAASENSKSSATFLYQQQP